MVSESLLSHYDYVQGRSHVRDGDLLLFRRRGLISIAGRGEYTHAAMAAWWGDVLFVLEMLQFKGGRAVRLSTQVQPYPGQWDVFRPVDKLVGDLHWDGAENADGSPKWAVTQSAVRYMKSLIGRPYGWHNVFKSALMHLPIVRCIVKASTDDQATSKRPPFCSQAIAQAWRVGASVDVVPNLADRLTEPCDLARSMFFKRKMRLYWTTEQAVNGALGGGDE